MNSTLLTAKRKITIDELPDYLGVTQLTAFFLYKHRYLPLPTELDSNGHPVWESPDLDDWLNNSKLLASVKANRNKDKSPVARNYQ